MKNLLMITILVLALFGCGEPQKQKDIEIPTVDVKNTPKIKIVYILVGKNIDYDKMSIDEITKQIEKDSVFQVNSINPELYIKPQIIKVYKV